MKVKPDMFVFLKIKINLKKDFEIDNPVDNLSRTVVSLCYCGLLWKNEILMEERKDIVILNDTAHVEFPYSTKQKKEGFWKIVSELITLNFQKYTNEFGDRVKANDRFLKNVNKKSKKQLQNTKENLMSKVTKEIAKKLNKDPKNYITKTFCRSAYT